MDVFKETFDAFSQRIRSPFAGSILLSFIVLNWKPVWFLLFANAKVVEKFDFFEQNTSETSLYIGPIFLGLAVALLLPWSRFFGAWVARAPIRFLKNLQTDEAQAQRIYQLVQSIAEERAKSDLEAAKEQAVLDKAQRLEEARGISEGAEEELRAQREKSLHEKNPQQEKRTLQQEKRMLDEPLYRKALANAAKTLGTDHPEYALRLNKLARLLQDKGDYDEAEALFRKALAIDAKTIGTDHPNYANHLRNLALLLQAKGDFDGAEPLLREAVKVMEAAVGAEEPDSISIRADLDIFLQERGKS